MVGEAVGATDKQMTQVGLVPGRNRSRFSQVKVEPTETTPPWGPLSDFTVAVAVAGAADSDVCIALHVHVQHGRGERTASIDPDSTRLAFSISVSIIIIVILIGGAAIWIDSAVI